MNTSLIQNAELNQQFISKIPLGRWGRVEEVGHLALYLCSETAGFINGTDMKLGNFDSKTSSWVKHLLISKNSAELFLVIVATTPSSYVTTVQNPTTRLGGSAVC